MSPRLYLEAGAALVLAIAFFWYRSHLIDVGESRVKAKDAEVVLAQTIHKVEVEARAKAIAEEQAKTYKATVASPPAADAPHLSVCHTTPSGGAVRPNAISRSDPHGAPEEPALVPGFNTGTLGSIRYWDAGPEIDQRFRDDDALILALQQRIAAEIGVCRPAESPAT